MQRAVDLILPTLLTLLALSLAACARREVATGSWGVSHPDAAAPTGGANDSPVVKEIPDGGASVGAAPDATKSPAGPVSADARPMAGSAPDARGVRVEPPADSARDASWDGDAHGCSDADHCD